MFCVEIEILLNSIGKSLKNFPCIPMPPSQYFSRSQNRLIFEERSYDIDEMKQLHEKLVSQLNEEQLEFYKKVMDAVNNDHGGLFFLYGSGGCGKTFLWKTIITRVRSDGKIVLPVASSGIAATLLPGNYIYPVFRQLTFIYRYVKNIPITLHSYVIQFSNSHTNNPNTHETNISEMYDFII